MERRINFGESVDDNYDLMLQEAFITGKLSHYRASETKNNIDPATNDIRHPEGKVIKSSHTEYAIKYLQESKDWMAYVSYFKRSRQASVHVVARTMDLAKTVIDEVFATVKEVVLNDPNKISLNFVFAAGNTASINPRNVDIQQWDNIKQNYSEKIVPSVDFLMDLTPENVAGKLMILHGPTGTGKTTLLACLAGKWKDWCRASYIIDPQRLLNDPQYMYNTLLGESYENGKWKLIIMEDSDDETRSDAKLSSHGPGLSNLLNITDGLLGQGRKLIIAITTNEKIGNLDPAIVRPGRLLKEIMVPELTGSECESWAASNSVEIPDKFKSRPLTLAELYAIKRGENPDPLNKKRVGF